MAKYRSSTRQDSTEQEDESAEPVMHPVANASEYNSEYVGFNVASSQDDDPSIVIDKRRNLRSS